MTNNNLINDAFDNGINENNRDEVNSIVREIISALDLGKVRVANCINGNWQINEQAKKAILLSFRLNQNKCIETNYTKFYDKVDSKFLHTTEDYLKTNNIRIVPQAIARYGSFIDKNVVLMPSFVNIGAYVGEGTMVDTWATVGSCAQVGRNVHLSGGVGIGGVLEPPGAMPVIIEDNAFIGSRSIIVEGVRVKKGAVIGANVTITASTPIIDVTGQKPIEIKGEVPENSVVIPGSRPKDFPSGVFNIPCALIIGTRKESTDEKTSLNDALRTFGVEV